jgi:hypothetical protein
MQAYRQRNFDRRMFKYFCRLHEKHNKKVCPLRCSLTTVRLRRRIATKWQTHIHRNNPMAAALLSKMNYTPRERVQVKLQFLRMLLRMQFDPARMQLLAGFF